MQPQLLDLIRCYLGSEDAVPDGMRPFLAAVDEVYARRVAAEHEAIECQERLLRVARATNDAVYDWDLATDVMWWNDGLCSLFGYEKQTVRLTLEWWRQHVHGEDRDRVETGLMDVFHGDSATWSDEYRFQRVDGSYAVVIDRCHIERDGAGRPARVIGSLTDVTARHEADANLRRLQQQLLQSQKMEAIGQLAGGIAHDFNNLLTVISMHCEFLADHIPPGQTHRPDLDAVIGAADRAASLTRQLLAFSRKQLLTPARIDLNMIVRGVEPMLRRLIGEDIRVVTVCRDGIGVVLADPRQMEQVLLNLVVNARDAMPGGGSVTIATTSVEIDESAAQVAAGLMEPGTYVVLNVSDTGHGIRPEVQERIFDPFFTTKEQGRGTGLGLSTVYGIVKQSGGHVAVYSEVGRGTLFKLYLPQVSGAPEASRERRVEPALPGNGTILLVEDEVQLRGAAKRQLERIGYSVLSACDGEEALRLAAHPGLVIDLLVTDVVMPTLGGRELAEALRRDRPELPVLFMSGYTDDDIFRRGMLPDDASFLAKPFTTQALASAVRSALTGSRAPAIPG